ELFGEREEGANGEGECRTNFGGRAGDRGRTRDSGEFSDANAGIRRGWRLLRGRLPRNQAEVRGAESEKRNWRLQADGSCRASEVENPDPSAILDTNLCNLPTSKPSVRESGKKWTVIQQCSASAKTSASTVARSKSPTASSIASAPSASSIRP